MAQAPFSTTLEAAQAFAQAAANLEETAAQYTALREQLQALEERLAKTSWLKAELDA